MTNLYTVELLLNFNCCSFNSQLFTSQFSAKQSFRVDRCAFSFIFDFVYRLKQLTWLTLREKCFNMKFFLVCILPYSVRARKNTDQKNLRRWTFFTHSFIHARVDNPTINSFVLISQCAAY